jgi:drug/metabolite transporter (DMT)-like permease
MRTLPSLGIAVLATSFASVFIRFAQAENVPTLSIAAWRMIFASLLLVPYTWVTRRAEMRSLSGQDFRLLLASGVLLGLHFAAWIASLGYTSVASSVVLVSMGPLFVGLGSWGFLRERPGPPLAIGILLSAAGSVVIGWGDADPGQKRIFGDILALVGAIMVAGYLMIGRKLRARLSLASYVAPVYGLAALTLLAIVIAGQQQMFGFGPRAYLWMLALALVPQLLGHSTLNWALRYLPATYVSIITLAEPIGASILAYVIFGEAVTRLTAVGAVLILLGILIASRRENASSSPPDGR